MIIGTGVDSVEIKRFLSWTNFTPQQLSRIFSLGEIQYASTNPAKKIERLAARFACKEAFCKALHAAYPSNRYSLLSVCKAVAVGHGANGAPYLKVNWQALSLDDQPDVRVHLSLTHTKTIATAYVVVEKTAKSS